MKFLKKIELSIRLFFHGLFMGMKNADATMLQQTSGGDEQEVNHKLIITDNVFDDLLQEKETQQVVEIRDKNYRVYRKSDEYEVKVTGMDVDGKNFDDEDSELHAVAVKKVSADGPRTKQYETKNYKIVLIQNSKEYENDIKTKQKEGQSGEVIDDKETLIFEVTYKDDIIPRFYVERYIQKVVLKENKDGKKRVDLYFSQYARQFMKRDSLFVAELHRIFSGISPKSDVLAINTLSFVTDKAYGADDLHRVTLTDFVFKKIAQFDGSFVIEFECKSTDEDIVEKYRTKELDEKYAKMEKKGKVTDINAVSRRIEKEEKEKEEQNYETTTLKLE